MVKHLVQVGQEFLKIFDYEQQLIVVNSAITFLACFYDVIAIDLYTLEFGFHNVDDPHYIAVQFDVKDSTAFQLLIKEFPIYKVYLKVSILKH